MTGIIRNGEKAGQFVPRNDFKSCTWHYINTAELAEAAGLDPGTPLVEAVIGRRTETLGWGGGGVGWAGGGLVRGFGRKCARVGNLHDS